MSAPFQSTCGNFSCYRTVPVRGMAVYIRGVSTATTLFYNHKWAVASSTIRAGSTGTAVVAALEDA